jgi:hypothetical protein
MQKRLCMLGRVPPGKILKVNGLRIGIRKNRALKASLNLSAPLKESDAALRPTLADGQDRAPQREYESTGYDPATLISKVTVLSPPAFLMTNLYFSSFAGVTFTEHCGPGESSLPTSLPASS